MNPVVNKASGFFFFKYPFGDFHIFSQKVRVCRRGQSTDDKL